ncbi:MAG: hypothetical protein SFZ23_15410 [Planctomycetota bacterium]|nr:hypothetical protein [Planctomycetota bacterium]
MLRTARNLRSILLLPVTVLWKFYGAAWWAFDPAPASPRRVRQAAHGHAQGGGRNDGATGAGAGADVGAGRESVLRSATQRLPGDIKPVRALRRGFAAWLVGAALLALLCRVLVASDTVSPSTGALAWVWSTGAALLGTLFFIRPAAARERARALAPNVLQRMATGGVAFGRSFRRRASACVSQCESAVCGAASALGGVVGGVAGGVVGGVTGGREAGQRNPPQANQPQVSATQTNTTEPSGPGAPEPQDGAKAGSEGDSERAWRGRSVRWRRYWEQQGRRGLAMACAGAAAGASRAASTMKQAAARFASEPGATCQGDGDRSGSEGAPGPDRGGRAARASTADAARAARELADAAVRAGCRAAIWAGPRVRTLASRAKRGIETLAPNEPA